MSANSSKKLKSKKRVEESTGLFQGTGIGKNNFWFKHKVLWHRVATTQCSRNEIFLMEIDGLLGQKHIDFYKFYA